MDNEKYGIELELVLDKFNSQAQKVKSTAKEIGNAFDPNKLYGRIKINGQEWIRGFKTMNSNLKGEVRQLYDAYEMVQKQRELVQKKQEEYSLSRKGKVPYGDDTYFKGKGGIDPTAYLQTIEATEKVSQNIEKATSKAKIFNVELKNIGSSNIGKSLEKMTSKIKRFGLSLLSIRSIWALVSRASSAYLAQNTELSNRLQSVWAGLGALLSPIIEGIVNTLAKAVKYIAIFIKALTGVDLLAKATAKSMGGTTKAAKGLNKALAGFDELNNLDTDAGGGTAGAGGLGGLEDVEINTEWAEKIKLFGEWINQNKDSILDFFVLLGTTIAGIKLAGLIGDLGLLGEGFTKFKGILLGLGIGLILYGIYLTIKGIVDFVKDPSWENFAKILTGLTVVLIGVALAMAAVNAQNPIIWIVLLIAVIAGVTAVVIQNWDKIKEVLSKVGTWIYDNIIKPVGDFFVNLWNKIVEGVKIAWNTIISTLSTVGSWIYSNVIQPVGNFFAGLWDGIKNKFQQVWDWIISAFSKGGQIFVGIKDGIVSTFKTVVNAIIGGINKAIATPFNKINGLLNKIKSAEILGIKPFNNFWGYNPLTVPQIPQLAVGTNYVPEDQLAMIHKGEAVVPKKFNSREYFGGSSDETNSILERVIEAIENIEINPYTTIKDVGKASLSYINGKSRQLGESVVR